MGMRQYPTSYTFTSRYGQIRSVTQVDPKRFVVEGETLYMRFGSDEATGFTMADFEGGPCVMSGDTLEEDIGHFPITHRFMEIKSVTCLSPEDAADLMGYTDSAMVKTFNKPDYAYVLVEVQ